MTPSIRGAIRALAPLSVCLVAFAALAAPSRAATPADFATRVLAWNGTGGVSGYNTLPDLALGAPSPLATPLEPDNTSVFSFGWGGSLTLGFDRPITDDPRHPGGYDFIVFGNALYGGGDETAPNREPGYVEVGVDPSGLHQYGDGSHIRWYWLKGTPAPATVAGFPIPLPSPDEPTIGYADCTPTDGTGDPLVPDDPAAPGITPGSAGGDAFDLAWAVDESGLPAHLASADFVRISCAVDAVFAVTGRISTEVDAVALVRPRSVGDVDGDGMVTLADAVLTARAMQGLAPLSDAQKAQADADGNGSLSPADLPPILRLASGLA